MAVSILPSGVGHEDVTLAASSRALRRDQQVGSYSHTHKRPWIGKYGLASFQRRTHVPLCQPVGPRASPFQ